MRTTSFIFKAEALSQAEMNINSTKLIEEFVKSLLTRVGIIIDTCLRLYRVPMHESYYIPNAESTLFYKQYALIALYGEQTDYLIEIVCNEDLNSMKLPKAKDIELGKRLTIEVVDWIDACLLIDYLLKVLV